MIRVRDASLLAFTKLRTRRVRTAISVFVSGMLFAGLVGALIVAAGIDKSLQSFSQEGLNSRYIVATAVDQPNSAAAYSDPVTVARAQQLYMQLIADKKAEAKKLGISYDSSTELSPVIDMSAGQGQTGTTERLNPVSPVAQQAIAEYAKAHPDPGIPELKADAKKYHPTDFYSTTTITIKGSLAVMQNGQENFSQTQSNTDRQKDIIQSNGIALTDMALTKPFLLPHTVSKTDDIPVVITYSQAAQLLGLTALSHTATESQQVARLRTLYAQAPSLTFSACYRNGVSEQQIQIAQSQAQEIAQNKNNKSYHKPNLIYRLPVSDSCGQATIISDTRTKTEKSDQDKQDQFNRMFGQEVDPVQRKLTFQVVGLKPDQTVSGNNTTMSGILKEVVGSSLDATITIPDSLFNALPDAAGLKSLLFSTDANPYGGFSPTTYFVEFASANDARTFIDQKSCTTGPNGRCGTRSKPFQLIAYGSNSIGIQDLKHKFAHFFGLAALVVVVVALIIMGATVGRMIADGRRETAVFRAIGAKRVDIASIYTVYTFCLSFYVAMFALVVGVVLAFAFDRHFWQSTTVQARLLFGASDGSREFHFFCFTPAIWLIALLAIMCGLVSMLLPLLRNVRRSPINDMREE